MKPALRLVTDTRPWPNAALAPIDDFLPDQDGLGAWAHRTFIAEGGALENPRHEHLRDAVIGWVWTSAANTNRGRFVAGECRMVPPPQEKWRRAMADYQLREWFGQIPDFVIIISAIAAAQMDDWSFCALVEHELCHAAQDMDEFGNPRFSRNGSPVFRMAGHDVEEFVDVVARYGADATGTRALVAAENAGPTVGAAQMVQACGTCLARRA